MSSVGIGIGLSLGGGSVPWSPARIPNVVAGWNAWRVSAAADANLASVVADVGTVALAELSSGKGAQYKPTGINSRPGLYFATDRAMTADAVSTHITGNDTPFTLYGVVQGDALGASQCLLSVGSSAANTRFHRLLKSATETFNVNRRGDADGAATTVTGSVISASAFAFVQVFTGTTVTVYANTALTEIIPSTALDLGSATLDRFTIGCSRSQSDSLFMTGHWGCCYVATGAQTSVAQISNFMRWAKLHFGTA